MWGDARVDPWLCAMLIVAIVSCALFFTKAKWAISLYAMLPIIWMLRRGYESAIDKYLSLGVPIRIDWPFVVMLAIFPVIPVAFHGVRMILNRTHKGSSNEQVQPIAGKPGSG